MFPILMLSGLFYPWPGNLSLAFSEIRLERGKTIDFLKASNPFLLFLHFSFGRWNIEQTTIKDGCPLPRGGNSFASVFPGVGFRFEFVRRTGI